jgi:phosphoenolpyruvate synthase/pyruvate phosphate dikinase
VGPQEFADYESRRQSQGEEPTRFTTTGLVYTGARTSLAPELPGSDAKAPDTGLDPQQADKQALSAFCLSGVGASPGKVRARVRVIDDPRTATLEPGEIIVARRTVPGWVILFPAAAGLLVEFGSTLSHVAIVARELSLPAIVSIAGLTAKLRTGDLVEFDAATGNIMRVAASPTAA